MHACVGVRDGCGDAGLGTVEEEEEEEEEGDRINTDREEFGGQFL